MVRLRVLTAAIGLPLIILSVMLGPQSFGVFLGVVAGLSTYELCRLAPGMAKWDPLTVAAVALSIVLAVAFLPPVRGQHLSLLVTLPVILSLMILLLPTETRRSFVQWAWTVAGAVYIGWLLGHWGGLYLLPSGRELVFFGMFTTFFYDTFAFFTGRVFGRRKLAPHLSAGKTWEGVGGGVLMAVAGGLLLRTVLDNALGAFPLSVPSTVIFSLCVAVAAQTGDLVESAVKRSAGAKDAGTILPGHGGMLDRFDSLLFVGPVLYYLSLWVTV